MDNLFACRAIYIMKHHHCSLERIKKAERFLKFVYRYTHTHKKLYENNLLL